MSGIFPEGPQITVATSVINNATSIIRNPGLLVRVPLRVQGRTSATVQVSPLGQMNEPVAYWWPSFSQNAAIVTRPEPLASRIPPSNVPVNVDVGVESSCASPDASRR